MRILMAHWRLGRSGAQIVMSQLSEHFRSSGHRVDFVTTVDYGLAAQEFHSSCDELWHCHDTGTEPPLRYLERFRSRILKRGYDVLVTHHSLQAVAVAGLLPTSIATVSVIHEHPVLGAGYVGLSNPDAFDAYVGVSNGVTEGIRSMLREGSRILCIVNGVPAGNCPDRLPRDEFHALYVGRLNEEQKGILLLPQIVRAARNRGIPLHLTLVGEGKDKPKLVEAIQESGAGRWISVLGSLPQNEVFDHMAAADVFLLCSHHEGLALVVLEAMVRGCVPIATDLRDSTAEAITPGVDGFLIGDRSPDSFADSIELLWRDSGRLTKMRAEAHRTASTRFSAQRMVGEYEALFNELLTLPAGRRRIQNCERFMSA
ncbi:MAG: glycosyltransferase family 4 protein [Fimbriimonadales bacterium]